MDYPSEIKDYCPKCNKHTLHKLKEWKARPFSRKFPRRQSRRFNEERKKGHGARVPKAAKNKKQAKRFIALATCSKCTRKHYFKSGTRMKKARVVKK
ncbi:MAG: 50S ribosomal protein L44e [Candidatus Diapherotrites archaeon]|nr:50S ribosomal protein L44e [Candidatus Diapherotrites archaeon]